MINCGDVFLVPFERGFWCAFKVLKKGIPDTVALQRPSPSPSPSHFAAALRSRRSAGDCASAR